MTKPLNAVRRFFHTQKQKGFDFMDDWKNRLVEEYHQLKERWEKLKNHNNYKEIAERLDVCHCPESLEERKQERKCRVRADLLRDQQHVMGEYLHILELRAELEGIEL